MTGGLGLSILVGSAVGALFVWLLPDTVPVEDLGGERRVRRETAVAKWPALRWMLPLVDAVSVKVKNLGLKPIRARLGPWLAKGGYPLGFDVDALLAVCILCSIGGACGGAFCSVTALGSVGPGVVAGGLLGGFWPLLKVDETSRSRVRTITRNLPHGIDLIALSMRAGADFPGAIRQIADRMNPENPLRFEFMYILRRLSLGASRREALSDMAERIASPVVRQFVASVIEAELQGTPLADVLEIQARVLRMRRTHVAERAAARAAVLVLGPLAMIFASVFVLLLGPFAIKFIRGELL